ncbi:HTTM domain-containing protein [uncultured Kriegella sp.]|uniref:HTTM domain-containing protein n=1 Tax=uncultured Kriegella sp. TaxID=1798910 RepID=UPI0030DBCCB4|tara:strand:+ start:119811 stop:121175 length:1365 start_codon:yes stop_codon:yes gene_type:complete
MNPKIRTYLKANAQAAPLAVFRIFFGLMMVISIIRFWYNGWIEKLYIAPKFFFSYYGFEWIRPLGNFTYLLFILCGVSAFFVALGYKYRIAILVFFLSFTYIELMDKTTYLNHYYFVSILSFLMLFLPANAYFSVDALKNKTIAYDRIPRWCIDILKLLLCMVYFYAGLAKLNSDWLFDAMPLKIWLPSKFDVPLLGDFLQQSWSHYTFSWAGMLYDLMIPFLLLYRRTRWLAFGLVVVFHLLTRVLFPIGMFPYIMIVSALIFFDADLHHRILKVVGRIISIDKTRFDTGRTLRFSSRYKKWAMPVIGVFFVVQLLLPWRYLVYPGELFWTEEGYRFSWRVMLMEKAGYAQFKVVDGKSKKWFYVDNSDFLTPFQEKQMATQPDFILQYAKFLAKNFKKQGHGNLEIYVESYVALNGRKSTSFINPDVNLLTFKDSFESKTFILPFHDTIKGL